MNPVDFPYILDLLAASMVLLMGLRSLLPHPQTLLNLCSKMRQKTAVQSLDNSLVMREMATRPGCVVGADEDQGQRLGPQAGSITSRQAGGRVQDSPYKTEKGKCLMKHAFE